MRVPAHVLQTLPATPSDKSGAFGFLATGTGLDPAPVTFQADGLDPAPVTFQADGLNFGLALALNVGLHQVRYR